MASSTMGASRNSDNVSEPDTVDLPSRTGSVLSRRSDPSFLRAQAKTLSTESVRFSNDDPTSTDLGSEQAPHAGPSSTLLSPEDGWSPPLLSSKARMPPIEAHYRRPGYLIHRPQSHGRSSSLQIPNTTLPSEFEGADTRRSAIARRSPGPPLAPPRWRNERKSRGDPSRFEEFVAGCKRLGGRRSRSNSLSQAPSQMSHGYQISLETVFPTNDQPTADSKVERLYNSAVMDSILDEINAIQSTIADREGTMSRIQGTAKEIQTAYKLDRQIYKVCSLPGE